MCSDEMKIWIETWLLQWMIEQIFHALLWKAVMNQWKIVMRIKNIIEMIASLKQELSDCEV